MVAPAARLEVVAPGLLPALLGGADDAMKAAALLARAEFSACSWAGLETALALACGIAWRGPGSPPLAAASARLDLGHVPPAPTVLRADPVYLRADPARVILFDADTLEITAAEADELIARVNAHCAADGFHLVRGDAATRWYATWHEVLDVPSTSPASLRGAVLEPDQAARRGLAGLRRVLTELQMVLHDCAVNRARAAAGKAPVNSVWPWGWGEMPQPAGAAPALLIGTAGEAAALAGQLGARHEAALTQLGARLAEPRGTVVLVVDESETAAALVALSSARAALARGCLAALRVHTAHGCFELDRRSARRWWRRPGAFLARWRATLADAAR